MGPKGGADGPNGRRYAVDADRERPADAPVVGPGRGPTSDRVRDWTVGAGVRWGLDGEHRATWQLGDVEKGRVGFTV